ncbi:MAG: hemolysin III family protein, partial [Thermoleophilia bacterium]|nr:hemolysin III family protein [Thermoleophilia bacterium]
MTAETKPRLRGVFHEWAFFASLGAAALLLVLAGSAREAVASSIYVAALAALFGVSALYHRVTWSPPVRQWMRRLDHSTIFVFIAG